MSFSNLFKKASAIFTGPNHQETKHPLYQDGETIFCKNNVCVHPASILREDYDLVHHPGYLTINYTSSKTIPGLHLVWVPNTSIHKTYHNKRSKSLNRYDQSDTPGDSPQAVRRSRCLSHARRDSLDSQCSGCSPSFDNESVASIESTNETINGVFGATCRSAQTTNQTANNVKPIEAISRRESTKETIQNSPNAISNTSPDTTDVISNAFDSTNQTIQNTQESPNTISNTSKNVNEANATISNASKNVNEANATISKEHDQSSNEQSSQKVNHINGVNNVESSKPLKDTETTNDNSITERTNASNTERTNASNTERTNASNTERTSNANSTTTNTERSNASNTERTSNANSTERSQKDLSHIARVRNARNNSTNSTTDSNATPCHITNKYTKCQNTEPCQSPSKGNSKQYKVYVDSPTPSLDVDCDESAFEALCDREISKDKLETDGVNEMSIRDITHQCDELIDRLTQDMNGKSKKDVERTDNFQTNVFQTLIDDDNDEVEIFNIETVKDAKVNCVNDVNSKAKGVNSNGTNIEIMGTKKESYSKVNSKTINLNNAKIDSRKGDVNSINARIEMTNDDVSSHSTRLEITKDDVSSHSTRIEITQADINSESTKEPTKVNESIWSNAETIASSHHLSFPDSTALTNQSLPCSPYFSRNKKSCKRFSIDLNEMKSLRLFFCDSAKTRGQFVIASRESQYKILHFHHGGLNKLAKLLNEWNFVKSRSQPGEVLPYEHFMVYQPCVPDSELHPDEDTFPEHIDLLSFFNSAGQIEDEFSFRKYIFFNGVPPKLRPLVWPFLLNYYAYTTTTSEREAIVRARRAEYACIAQSRNSLSGERREEFARSVESVVEKDVIRTDRGNPFYAGEGNPHVETMKNILLNYAVYDAGLGYTQGMSDLLAPVLAEIREESDAFWCFTGLLRRGLFVCTPTDSDMEQNLNYFRELIRIMEPSFYEHLTRHVDAMELLFCHRWILLCFKREFQTESALTIWEACWSSYASEYFHLFVCLAIVSVYGNDVVAQNLRTDEMLLHFSSLANYMDAKLILRKARGLVHNFRQFSVIPCTLVRLCQQCGPGIWDSSHVPNVVCENQGSCHCRRTE